MARAAGLILGVRDASLAAAQRLLVPWLSFRGAFRRGHASVAFASADLFLVLPTDFSSLANCCSINLPIKKPTAFVGDWSQA